MPPAPSTPRVHALLLHRGSLFVTRRPGTWSLALVRPRDLETDGWTSPRPSLLLTISWGAIDLHTHRQPVAAPKRLPARLAGRWLRRHPAHRDLAVPGHHRIGPWVLSRHPGARDLTLWRLPEWDCARHAPDDEGDWTTPAIWSPHLPCSCPRHSRWLEIVLALAGPDLPQAPGEEPPF
ncbi:hypothetical protein ACFV4M_10780 [Kitasatospora indigofera]|uniref:hypothetical protein n=1 Tax=Kitasatospora indigofera TaxID=67307 RepID=UPI003658F959